MIRLDWHVLDLFGVSLTGVVEEGGDGGSGFEVEFGEGRVREKNVPGFGDELESGDGFSVEL